MPTETPDTAPPPTDIAIPASAAYSVFEPQWPGPGRIAPRRAAFGSAVTALVAAAALSWDKPGAGWFATAAVGAMAVVVTTIGPGTTSGPLPDSAPRPARDREIRAIWAVLALALTAVGAVRAAGWLWLLCLPTACVCGALALVGGRSFAGLVKGALVFPAGVVRALPWGLRGVVASRGAGSSIVRTLAAVCVGLALLAVFATLLASADAAFATIIGDLLPTLDGATLVRWLGSGIVVGLGTLAACFLALRPPAYDKPSREPRWSLRRIEWAIPVGVLIVLFTAFVAVQATVLFGGGAHVLRTAGLTYAEYARQGFWQLLAVTALTLVVLAAAGRLASRRAAGDRAWARLMLGVLSVLSLLIVASALSRMWAYEQAYGFSRLRLLVSVCELWLGLVFVMILAAGIRLRGRWIPRVAAQSAAAALIAIAALNPDHFVAAQNIARDQSRVLDLAYLAGLSADAVPALDRLEGDERRCVLNAIAEDLTRHSPDRWAEWNLGRYRARMILADSSSIDDSSTGCWEILNR